MKEQLQPELKIYGLQKLTCIDFPDLLACTIFCAGCNFRCKYCQNRSLVVASEFPKPIPTAEVLAFLRKRKDTLEGVCLSGGEMLLQEGLEAFIEEIKDMGYRIKLDTNGFYFDRLKSLIQNQLVDYVAMDVKQCKEKYHTLVQCDNLDVSSIDASIQFLKQGNVPYEFRTTIVKELHSEKDVQLIAQWVANGQHLYLQSYRDEVHLCNEILHAWDEGMMQKMRDICLPYINTTIR